MTQKPEAKDVERIPDAQRTERRVNGWIGQAVRVEGKVISSEDLTIDGQLEGSLEIGDHNLTIGASADVHANLRARSILVLGSVVGNLHASDKVDLRATASVAGDIVTPRLILAEGSTVNGAIETGPGRKKSD